MPENVKAVPEGYHAITPYLIVNGADKAIEFYTKAFGAQERVRMPMPDGRVGHAELAIGDSFFMLADESPEVGARSPRTIGGSPVSIVLYIENVDAVVERAVAAGARLETPVEDKFYGDRSGTIEDPFGHHWHIMTHIEDVSPEEMKRRMAAAV